MRRMGGSIALGLLLGLAPLSHLAGSAAAPPPCRVTSPAVTRRAGHDPRAVLVADVTGDGRDDLLQTNSRGFDDPLGTKLMVYEQRASGILDVPRALPIDEPSTRVGPPPLGIAVADFDEDGAADVAVATEPGIDFFYGGENLDQKHLLETASAHLLSTGDFDGDGSQDLIAATHEGVLLVRHAGARAWTVDRLSDDLAWDIKTGDVNGDGRADVALSTEGPLVVLTQNGGGAFSRTEHATDASSGITTAVAVGDITGDAKDDVVHVGNGTTVFAQTADGGLEPVDTDLNLGGGPITFADWTGNDAEELIYAPPGSLFAAVYRAGPEFVCGYTLPELSPPTSGLAVGDLNDDDAPDLAVSGTTLLYQRTRPLVVPESILLRPYKKRSLYLAKIAFDERGEDYSGSCGGGVVVQRFSRGRWRHEAGPFRALTERVVKTSGKPGAYRAVVRRRAGERGSTVCSGAISTLVGSSADLRAAGCRPLRTAPSVPLEWEGGDVTVGDYDSDGRADVAVAASTPQEGPNGEVLILHGTGGGHLGDSLAYGPSNPGTRSPEVATGDFDGDGADDLAIQSSSSLIVFFQRDGKLTDGVVVEEGSNGRLVADDFDQDGNDDILADDFQLGPQLWHGPDFRPDYISTWGYVIGDVNGDGLDDIGGGGERSIAYRIGNGAYASVIPNPRVEFIDGSTTGDLNGDGQDDVVAWTSQFGGGTVGQVPGAVGIRYVTRENGLGPLHFLSAISPGAAAVGDATGDGRNDLLVGEFGGVVSIRRQTSAGRLTEPCPLWPGGPGILDLEVVDLAGVKKPTVLAIARKSLLLLRVGGAR